MPEWQSYTGGTLFEGHVCNVDQFQAKQHEAMARTT